ncbi:sensor kinase/phosphatase LuxQ [Seminavis robusta]|uniref:histidine kinase n=1 Tax=Seminavis robusta TaxID=568900 RepID=A0A9N8EU49_9STRA|nr:sensor kinase/phosphatase LuxQ [Seminavis robusta]|eukprot:Sro1957_g307820.1 sensor kinase/phosphatase LuxQ (903) ;mRNA; r:11404-14904
MSQSAHSKSSKTGGGSPTAPTRIVDLERGRRHSSSSNKNMQNTSDLLRGSGISNVHLIDLVDTTQATDGFATFPGRMDNASSSSNSDIVARGGGKRSIIFAFLIFLVGAGASAAFLSIGILHAKQDQANQFDQLTSEFVVKLQDAFHDYELFGLWIVESCRAREGVSARNGSSNVLGICSRQDFRELYIHIRRVGLEFQSAQFMPRVSRDEREAVEASSRSFYKDKYPHVNYRGVVGLFIDDEGVKVEPQDERDFYWPVHYVEPVVGNEAAIELDLYSSPTQQKTIEHATSSWLPSVTDRLKLVQETDPNAYSIIIHHPGIPLSPHNSTGAVAKPSAISLMVIRMPALLARTNADASNSASFYIYDATHKDEDPVFLGAHTSYAQPDGVVTFRGLPELSLVDLEASVKTPFALRKVSIADREWKVVVVALPDTYEPQIGIVVVGGVIIAMASLILSTCFWFHMSHVKKVNAEKAQIVVDTARQQALAERQLNDYVAHEVRNPLSSAIAALSFVTAAAQEPTQTSEDKKNMIADLQIVDSSLQFINELLRNMLDMHRAANQQMEATMAPTDILRDVFEPVASILYLRGNKVKIMMECPPNIVVMSDRLRLKQIVMNLAMNSTKFVQKGFIKLKCVTIEASNGAQSVQIHLEDSGPGIPPEKRQNLFDKFQESLDLLNQGIGIGLCLCKHLTNLIGGELYLDEEYDSGVQGCPGTRFVVDLRTPPVDETIWDERQTYPLGATGTETHGNLTATEHGDASIYVEEANVQNTPDEYETDNCDQTTPQPPAALSPAPERPSRGGTQHQHGQSYHPRNTPKDLPESLKVLFTDDDTILRKLFSRSLRRIAPGWEVHVCDIKATIIFSGAMVVALSLGSVVSPTRFRLPPFPGSSQWGKLYTPVRNERV